jgi:hypothetical protein
MDPVSLIVTALATGASAALTDTATQAVKDAYAGLKSLLKRKLSGNASAQVAIDKHAEAPDVWEKPLEAELRASRAAQDEEIVRSAQRILELLDAKGAAAGKYNVTITGGKGVVVGDKANVTMTFKDDD